MMNIITIKKVTFASFIMMASVFASRLIGLVRDGSIAYVGGARAEVDAYQIAFVIPEILNHVVASGFLSITFIPIFTHYLMKDREDEGWKIFSIIFNSFGLLLLVFILVSMVFAHDFLALLVPGITDPTTFKLAVKMTRIILPAQFFFFTGGLFMAVQFAKERFFIPALAPLIYNIGIICGGLLLQNIIGIEGFAWGVLAGAFFGNLFLQYFGARKTGMKYQLIFGFNHSDFKKYILLTLPLMLGLTMTFSTEILFKYFGSFLNEGSIAALNYALRIMFILVGFFGQAVGMASYPFLAELASNGNMIEMNRLLNTTLKFLFIVIPFSILFAVLRYEIVLILFQRGKFDSEATLMTSDLLAFFMIGAFSFSCQTIVVRGFYAMQNTFFPAIFSTAAVILTLPILYFLMKTMGASGIALGLSIGMIIQTLLLFEIWNKKSNNSDKKQVYLFFIKIVPVSLLIGIILLFTASGLRVFIDAYTFWGAILISIIIGVLFVFLLIVSGSFFKIEEIQILNEKISKRIFSWMKK
jgi:putative peptidoglycan lipid II flippase